MAFPTSPTNGQITVVNNVSYQYSNVSNSWTRILSTANIITANTIVSNGYISAAGNISGNYIFGNGSQLTGITLNPGNISNGTSNVTVVSSGGNATVNIGGTSNIAVFATTGEYVTGIISASGNIISAGNVTGGNLLTGGAISATGTLSVTGTTTLGTASTGNLSAGNVTTGGLVSAAGNVTGGNLLASGIISATGAITSASNISLTGNIVDTGELWINTLANGNINLNVNGTGQTNIPTGILSVTGNIQGGNLRTAGLISAGGTVTGTSHLGEVVSVTANVTGGNLLTAGLISAVGNITGGNVLTGGLISATSTVTSAANITGGNILTAGLVSATGNVTGNFFIGNGSQLTGIAAGTPTQIVSGTSNVSVVSSGGNVSVGIGGTSNVAVFATTGAYVTGVVSATANITGGNIITAGLATVTGDVTGGNLLTAGLVTAAGNITGGNLRTAGLITATGNITGGNVQTVGQISATGNITGNYYIGNGAFLTGLNAGATSSLANGATSINIPVSSGNIAMSVGGESNTVVVNLGSLTMYGTFAGPKTLAANVAVADSVNALLLGPVTIGNGYHIDVPSNSTLSTYGDDSPDIVGATLTVSGNITGGNVLSNGLISTAGNILTTGLISATGNILTSGLISATGNITGNNIFTSGDILPTANATANIGNLSFQYNTIFAKATSAQYADLAENYEADANYEPGTVVCFGGAKEVTVCNLADCISVAGVVSTNPSYLMNSGQTGEYVAAVALQGRVPTKVTGQIRKGDLIVSAGDGRGRANNNACAGTIIGKALVNSEGDAVIEVVVGRN